MLPLSLAIALTIASPPDDLAATLIGLKAHADAAALQKLPRFDYQARTPWRHVEAMRAENKAGLDELIRALDGEISQKRGEGLTWYEFDFASEQVGR